MEKIHLQQAIVTEGRYDRDLLSTLFDTAIICTHGFTIFKDKEQQALIKKLAHAQGIIVITDSDRAGFKIRGFVSQLVRPEQVRHAYIPEISGKEKRKTTPSSEMLIGVEGMERDVILSAISTVANSASGERAVFDTALFYSLGLCGAPNSAQLRRDLQKRLGLPSRMSQSALKALLPSFITPEQLKEIIKHV